MLKLLDHFSVKLSSNNKLSIDGRDYTKKQFFKDIKGILATQKEVKEIKDFMSSFSFSDTGLEDAANSLFIESKKSLESLEGSDYSLPVAVNEEVMPIVILEKGSEEVFMLNTTTGQRAKMGYEAWKKLKGGKASASEIMASQRAALVRYMPFVHKTISKAVDQEGQSFNIINPYFPPPYSVLEDQVKPGLDPILVEFFEHLFPLKTDREFVYDWIHHSLTSRCHTYLCLYSIAQQTGKSTFSEILLTNLHGAENSTPVKGNFPSPTFNGLMQNKTYLHGQEFSLRGKDRYEKYEALKGLTSDTVKLEEKNVKEFTARLHFSGCFTGNSMSPFPLVASEVRFSFPHLTSTPLIEAKGIDWVNVLYKTIKTPEVLAKAARFFKERKPKYNDRKHLVNDKFFEVVKYSAHKFIKFIIGYIKDVNEVSKISVDYLIKLYRKEAGNNAKLPQEEDIHSFFETYVEDHARVAQVELSDHDCKYYITPLNKYAKDATNMEEV